MHPRTTKQSIGEDDCFIVGPTLSGPRGHALLDPLGTEERLQIDAVMHGQTLRGAEHALLNSPFALFMVDEDDMIAVVPGPTFEPTVNSSRSGRGELVKGKRVHMMHDLRHASPPRRESTQDARLRRMGMHQVETMLAEIFSQFT